MAFVKMAYTNCHSIYSMRITFKGLNDFSKHEVQHAHGDQVESIWLTCQTVKAFGSIC